MAKYRILDDFYKGKEWITFRAAYIHERIKLDNGSICDWCGEWIEKESDITLHHEEELTPDNVMDKAISLNHKNIKQVHAACHNQIHKHAGERPRQVYLVYGPPGAGKENYVSRRAWHGDLIVNIDTIYQAITGLDKYDKPQALYFNAAAIQNLLIDQIKTRTGKWDNAWIIGGYADKYKRDKVVKDTGAKTIYLEATKEKCLENILLDPMRRPKEREWIKYIDKWFMQHTQ